MNNKEFVSELSQRLNSSADETQKMLRSVIDEMCLSFVTGASVSIQNFGTFEVKKKMERVMVNPSTQQRMLIPPKLVLNFKPSVLMKEKINQRENKDE